MTRVFIIMLFVLAAVEVNAQEAEREKIRTIELQKEQEKSRYVRQQMDSGIFYMNQEKYELADSKLRYALSNLKSIPSDLAFYFGKNSYFLGKYKQSVDWLTKYIQLKGTTGQYSTEAAQWLKMAEKELVAEHASQSQNAVEVLSRDYTIDCGPAGRVSCPVCSGSTVIIRKDYLHGETYRTCPYCNKVGTLSCEDYNKLLRGELKPASN
ncbi:MAG: hypothetical protein JST14_14395 [Bacteroidetes bacterium]|nr:hypothetical protein [Bacteroidota bacterium]MBS1976931.1 hypothetical protein [Bacteroidota bacterium]